MLSSLRTWARKSTSRPIWRVGVVEEAGEGRLKLDGELLLLGAEAVRRFDPWVAGRQHRVRRDDALIGQEKAPLDESGRL
ncbi:MAG: hypothetical protein ACXVA7_19420 [Isosphaeraceae bacterium]